MSGALHVEATGQGPPLVLLHGWAMHSEMWGPLLPRLARRFRVHAVDLPGHGLSVPPPAFTLDGVVAATRQRCRAQESGRRQGLVMEPIPIAPGSQGWMRTSTCRLDSDATASG